VIAIAIAPTQAQEPAPTPDTVIGAASSDAPSDPVEGIVGRAFGAVTSTFGLALLAVLTTAVVIFTLVFYAQANLGGRADSFDASQDAQAVAERGLSAALSYDYNNLPIDLKTATSYMTPRLAQSYRKSYQYVCPGKDSPATAVARKSVMQADVVDTGVLGQPTPTRVKLLVFVNQLLTNIYGTGDPLQNSVIAVMVRTNGQWLIDDLKNTTQVQPCSTTTTKPTN
jgi:hypothetical protein